MAVQKGHGKYSVDAEQTQEQRDYGNTGGGYDDHTGDRGDKRPRHSIVDTLSRSNAPMRQSDNSKLVSAYKKEFTEILEKEENIPFKASVRLTTIDVPAQEAELGYIVLSGLVDNRLYFVTYCVEGKNGSFQPSVRVIDNRQMTLPVVAADIFREPNFGKLVKQHLSVIYPTVNEVSYTDCGQITMYSENDPTDSAYVRKQLLAGVNTIDGIMNGGDVGKMVSINDFGDDDKINLHQTFGVQSELDGLPMRSDILTRITLGDESRRVDNGRDLMPESINIGHVSAYPDLLPLERSSYHRNRRHGEDERLYQSAVVVNGITPVWGSGLSMYILLLSTLPAMAHRRSEALIKALSPRKGDTFRDIRDLGYEIPDNDGNVVGRFSDKDFDVARWWDYYVVSDPIFYLDVIQDSTVSPWLNLWVHAAVGGETAQKAIDEINNTANAMTGGRLARAFPDGIPSPVMTGVIRVNSGYIDTADGRKDLAEVDRNAMNTLEGKKNPQVLNDLTHGLYSYEMGAYVNQTTAFNVLQKCYGAALHVKSVKHRVALNPKWLSVMYDIWSQQPAGISIPTASNEDPEYGYGFDFGSLRLSMDNGRTTPAVNSYQFGRGRY